MRRRSFIAGLGGAVASPIIARAQQNERTRVIGMLIAARDNDAHVQIRVEAFRETLNKLGWIEGRNLHVELRYGTGNTKPTRDGAVALLALDPDLVVVSSTPGAKAVRQLNKDVPIIFTTISDPVPTGLVSDLAHPESNTTGFALLEPSIGAKWVELLKEASPQLRSVAQVSDPANANEAFLRRAMDAARALEVQIVKIEVQNVSDIVNGINTFAAEPHGGLLFPLDNTIAAHRDTIFGLAVRHRLPAIYGSSYFSREGGLMSYGPDLIELYTSAAVYVDGVLRGTKVNELPVQFPTKFDLVINLKAAKAIDLSLPPSLLARADEVIE